MLLTLQNRLLAIMLAFCMTSELWAQAGPSVYQAQDGPQQPPAHIGGQPIPQFNIQQAPPAGQLPVPFEISDEHQVYVNQILALWEKESNKIKTFTCTFERFEYNSAFGPGKGIPLTKSTGQLKYAKPDKGLFRITERRRYNPKTRDWDVEQGDPNEHWVCDGKAVYEFDAGRKQVNVYSLPPELQGKGIADGPLPFLFGAEATKLMQRYFIQVTQQNNDEIWLEAWPRFQRDAADYQRIELILDRKKFSPKALKVYLPNTDSQRENSTVYKFDPAKVNDPIDRFLGVFQKPRTPFGWKKVVAQPPPATAPPPRQAARPGQGPGAPRIGQPLFSPPQQRR